MYSPEVGYTLISVGRLDDLGFELTFGGGKCTIRASDGKVVGVVPKDDGGSRPIAPPHGPHFT